MADISKIRKYYRECNPEKALPAGDEKYIDFEEEHLRGLNCREKLFTRITINEDELCHQLFAGFKGCGKSTELLALKEKLNQAGYLAIYGDAKEYLSLNRPLSVAEVLYTICAVFDDHLTSEGVKGVMRKGFYERLRDFMKSEVKVEEFGIGVGGLNGSLEASMKAAVKYNPTFKDELNKFLENQLPRFKEEAFNFLAEAIANSQKVFRKKSGNSSKGVVLILDTLEQLRADTSESDAVRESIRNVFFNYRDYLQVPCHAIYSVPPWLALIATPASLWEHCAFSAVRLHERESGAEVKESFKMMAELIDKRAPLEEVFGLTQEQTAKDQGSVPHQMIRDCGGYFRDLLRMLQDFLLDVKEDDSLPLPHERQQQIWEVIRAQMIIDYNSPLVAEEYDWLVKVAETKELEYVRNDMVDVAAAFLDYHFILCYMDQKTRWHDLHPLVKELKPIKARLSRIKK